MLDADLAALYGVDTRNLDQAVTRNRRRFPADFMFRLTAGEAGNLTSQIVMSSSRAHGGRRHTPFVFTEQRVAMLSSALRSERAIAANILIMRTIVQLRQALSETARLGHRIDGTAPRDRLPLSWASRRK